MEIEMESSQNETILPWNQQITVRGIFASVVIGSVFALIAIKLVLTTGITPNLNVSAALLAFIFIKVWTQLLQKFGINSSPFTKQENTMIQTCIVACYAIAVGGGFGAYLLGMSRKTFEQSGGRSIAGNSPNSIKQPGFGWMTAFLFLVSVISLFVLIPLRKILIIDYKLTFPTGVASAVLINGFHSKGDKISKKQVKGFMKSFCFSFLWGFFQWFYTALPDCGFSQFPTFGLQARKNTFYFDFSLTYVGTGMICPHIVNLSLLLGAVLSYGMMWPLIRTVKGEWYPRNIPEASMRSVNGYQVFISIAILLGDGLYNVIKILCVSILNIRGALKARNTLDLDDEKRGHDAQKDEAFVRGSIPLWIGGGGYIVLAMISVIALPFVIPQLKWYLVLGSYVFAPFLAFCNAYGAGLTDINMSFNYGKVGLFVVAALSGREHGVIAALAACGIFKAMTNVSCILMQDFKTGHLTFTSPRTMLASQVIGTALGCLVSPLCFLLFYKAFDVGNPMGEYKSPFAIVYRNLAIVSVQGFGALPEHCLQLCYGFFAFAVLVNLVRDVSTGRIRKWMPLPTAMAVPFLIGGYFAIDMCVGSLVVFVWQKVKSKSSNNIVDFMIPAVASGLMCGESIWSLPAAILALAKVTPPMCMRFLPK